MFNPRKAVFRERKCLMVESVLNQMRQSEADPGGILRFPETIFKKVKHPNRTEIATDFTCNITEIV